MDIVTVINSIFIIIILFILFKNKILSNTKNEDDKGFYKFDDTFTDYEKKLLTKIHSKFYKYSNSYVPLDIFYSVLWTESSAQILKDVPNENIIGDNGNSIGYMQVNKYGALIEYNQRQNDDLTFDDLKDESINIKVGQAYLYYALQQAYKQSKNKPVQWLVFKKYNGGLDETETSINSMAEKYADLTYSRFLKVTKFINLNFA